MSDKMENDLRDSQLASLGKLLTGYTHELKNHLAIINESSGLMSDLLDMTEGEDDKIRQRFKKIIATIDERISQANTMAKYLNSLAHRMDLPTAVFSVNDLLIEELALIDRFAKMKNIPLEKNLQRELSSVFNNPTLLQFIVFSIVNDLLAKLDSGSTIEISSQAHGQDIEVNIEGIGPCSNAAASDGSGQISQILAYAAEKMNIGLNQGSPEGDRLKITLILPAVFT